MDLNIENKTEAREKGGKNHRFLRALLRFFCVLLVLLLAGGAWIIAYAQFTKTHYRITFYQQTSRKIAGSIRLAVISDIHNQEYGEGNETLLADLCTLKPDLILFAGDMVIREEDNYTPMLSFVAKCAEIAPCYGVLGNHESERIYFRNDRDLTKRFEDAGLRLLRNDAEKIRIGDETVLLLGVEGTVHGFEEYGGRKFMESLDLDPSLYSVLMTHIPILFESKLSGYAFDLGIAGHTHGGIVNVPFLGGLYSDEEGFFPKFSGGQMTLKNGQSLIISSGLGDSSPFPPRINNAPELIVIDISRY